MHMLVDMLPIEPYWQIAIVPKQRHIVGKEPRIVVEDRLVVFEWSIAVVEGRPVE